MFERSRFCLGKGTFTRCVLTLLLVCTTSFSGVATAGSFFKEAWGVVTDPFKLGSAGRDILHAIQRADMMLDKTDVIIEGQIDNIDEKVTAQIENLDSRLAGQIQGVDTAIESRMAQAVSGVKEIETKIYDDALKLITCGPEIAGLSAEKTLANLLNKLGDSKPRFTIFGIEIGRVEFDEVDIRKPINSYERAKALVERNLAELKEEDSAREILNVYFDMPRVADITACHYKGDNPVQLKLIRDRYEYIRKARSWNQFII